MSIGEQPLGKPDNHRRLAGAADGEIADTDNRVIQPFLFQNTMSVQAGPQTSQSAVKQGKRPKQQSP
jgi:hypothetical protein